MREIKMILLTVLVFISCNNGEDDNAINQINEEDVCAFKTELIPPEGFVIATIGEINYKGNVEEFQFIDNKIGFALMSNNIGGYVELFKTSDGGSTWSNLNIGINRIPINMIFKDEQIGIITVHDLTGCPPPNCQHKCVLLKTTNGGLVWEKIEFEELSGILYHPQFDKEGNLYALLSLDGQSKLMKSVDNGESWEVLYSSSKLEFSLTFSFRLLEDKIYLSGANGQIIVVDTNGDFLRTFPTDGTFIWDIELIDENNFVVVVSGKVIKTTNGGETWETIYDKSARMIGFETPDKGLMILKKTPVL